MKQHAAHGLLNDLAGLGRPSGRRSRPPVRERSTSTSCPLDSTPEAAVDARHHPRDHASCPCQDCRKRPCAATCPPVFRPFCLRRLCTVTMLIRLLHLALHAFKADQLVELGLQIRRSSPAAATASVRRPIGRGRSAAPGISIVGRRSGASCVFAPADLLGVPQMSSDMRRMLLLISEPMHVQLRSNDLIPVIQGDSLLRNQVASSIPHLPCLVHPSHGFDGQVI